PVVADSRPLATARADARRTAGRRRARGGSHCDDESPRTARGRRSAARRSSGQRRVGRRRRRTAGDGNQDLRSQNPAGLDFLREQLMNFVPVFGAAALALVAASVSAQQVGTRPPQDTSRKMNGGAVQQSELVVKTVTLHHLTSGDAVKLLSPYS